MINSNINTLSPAPAEHGCCISFITAVADCHNRMANSEGDTLKLSFRRSVLSDMLRTNNAGGEGWPRSSDDVSEGVADAGTPVFPQGGLAGLRRIRYNTVVLLVRPYGPYLKVLRNIRR